MYDSLILMIFLRFLQVTAKGIGGIASSCCRDVIDAVRRGMDFYKLLYGKFCLYICYYRLNFKYDVVLFMTIQYIVLLLQINSFQILFNKFVLSQMNFEYPMTLTAWHMALATILTQIMARTTNMLPGVAEVTKTFIM